MSTAHDEAGTASGTIQPARMAASVELVRRWLRLAASEPIVHFVLAGALLFFAGTYYQRQTSIYRIVLTPQHVRQLANDYALQFGSAPDATTLAALVRRDMHDEILYREGLALKLDRDDEIVRRRVVQKMQFLMQDLTAPPEPTTAELTAYYRAHAKRYITPPQATFSHIFFAIGPDGDAKARARAQAELKKLPDSLVRAPDRGDPFPDLYDFANYEPEQVYRLFGHTPFTQAVFSATPGHWIGPVRSSYGWHLIYVDSRAPANLPPLAKVRDQVRTDYLQDAQTRANKAAFETLARKFTVTDSTGRPLE